ncbi:MAG TPA: hypothetical protein VHO69_10830, partial [Phototrophicaceae bacterium]|nr:hypothetical protein [Phototrophicaceae bacterium]
QSNTGSQGTIIQDNVFRNNTAIDGAAISIFGNSGTSSPIVIQYNTFESNSRGGSGERPGIYDPVILINEAVVNIFSNRFNKNNTLSIIRVKNEINPNYEVNVFGNAFTKNTNTRPVIHLAPGKRFRFINNTVAGSRSIDGDYRYIILRGAPEQPSTVGGLWEIYNNLFYNNDNPNSLILSPIADLGVGTSAGVKCDSISGGPDSDNGARYNWMVNSGNPVGDNAPGGICQNPVQESTYGNRVEQANSPWFQVIGSVSANDPYQLLLAPGSAQALPYPVLAADDGIDDGLNSLVPSGAGWTGIQDVFRRARFTSAIDIGAYEFKPVEAIDVNPPPFAEDTPSIQISLQADGGFAPYTFNVETLPEFYDTDISNACGGQPLGYNLTTDPGMSRPIYCPPKNFYTQGRPQTVHLTYRVTDAGGNVSAPAEVNIILTPVTDDPLTTAINQTILVAASRTAETDIIFQLRPFVSFAENFVYSEDNGTTNAPGADYPYTYSYVAGSLAALDGTNLTTLGITEGEISTAIAGATNSSITLHTNAGEKGLFSFQYRSSADNGTLTPPHKITVEIVPSLPTGGLHDDTSFSFNYSGNWTALYSEVNINNTLHQSKTVSAAAPDTAEFRFVGTGFALYMQGSTSGNYWELQVDGEAFNWNGSQTVKRGSITCTTSATTGTLTNSSRIYNRTANAYVVSCTRLRPGEAHTITVKNSIAGAILSVDAIGILTESAVRLNPGFHEVSEAQLTSLFAGWATTTERGSSNGIAKVATSTMPDLRFTFRGTGFAIGTTLEQERLSKLGATYDICVKEVGSSANPICQSFNNALGASTSAIWNVFRPVYGFNPNFNYEVTIHNIQVQAGSRLVLDSIVVFDRQPTHVLPLGTTEDTDRDAIILGGGLEDTWTLDTNNTRVSNSSLTSIISTVTKAGPFISFQIPDAADSIVWWRYASSSDSQYLMICVDRGQLENTMTPCIMKASRTISGRTTITNNPIIINETDFTGGWGTAWGNDTSHTIEIFSLTNHPFNLDRLQVLDTDGVLSPAYYEQTVPNLTYFDDTAADGLSKTDVTNSRASGGSTALIKEKGEGVFFRFTGTGFSTLFTLDRYGGPVKICWKPNGLTSADVIATGTCQTFNNYSSSTVYQAARTVMGLTSGNYAAVILHDGADYKLTGTVYTGNTMYVDAVQTYGDQWDTLAELNTVATRYETSYINRITDNRFQYVGSAWKSVSLMIIGLLVMVVRPLIVR